MSKNKFLFILAAASLLTLGSCGGRTAMSSGAAQGSSSAQTSSAALASSSTTPSTSSSAVASSSNNPSSTTSSSTVSSSTPVSSASSSEEESQDGLVYILNGDKAGYTVVGYVSSETSVTIPSVYQGLPVTAIGDEAFRRSHIAEVSMPDSVTAIGRNAFYLCEKLASVTFSKGLISIGDFAFCNSAITSISLPESLKKVGVRAFLNCSNLTYTTENGLSYLPSGANDYFLLADAAYGSLTTVTIRSETKAIEDCAFSNCLSLASFAVDSGNTNYSTDGKALFNKDQTTLFAYAYCAGTSYSIPTTVTEIGDYAFFSCRYLETLVLPSALISIGDEGLGYCTGLNSLSLPASLTGIGVYAFENCASLTSIALPASLTSIGEDTFYQCTDLANVSLPASLTSIGDKAFYSCKKLATMNYNDTKAQWAKVTLGDDWHYDSTLLTAVTCTDGSVTL